MSIQLVFGDSFASIESRNAAFDLRVDCFAVFQQPPILLLLRLDQTEQNFLDASRASCLKLLLELGFKGSIVDFDVHGSSLLRGTTFCFHRGPGDKNVKKTQRPGAAGELHACRAEARGATFKSFRVVTLPGGQSKSENISIAVSILVSERRVASTVGATQFGPACKRWEQIQSCLPTFCAASTRASFRFLALPQGRPQTMASNICCMLEPRGRLSIFGLRKRMIAENHSNAP